MSKLKKLPERRINKKQLEVLWKNVEPRVSEIFEEMDIAPYVKGMKLIDGYHHYFSVIHNTYVKLLRFKVGVQLDKSIEWITLYVLVDDFSVGLRFVEKGKQFSATFFDLQQCIEWKNKEIMPDIVDWSYVDKPYKPKDWKWIGDYY